MTNMYVTIPCCNFQQAPSVVVLPQFAIKNHIVTLSHLPPTQWEGEENQKEKRQKLTGCNENNLTEWQREKKTMTNNPVGQGSRRKGGP